MIAKERAAALFDPGTLSLDESPGRKGFLIGQGRINQRPAYICAIDRTESPDQTFLSFSNMNAFLERILKNPAPVVLMMDLPASHTASQKSPFPDDPEKLLADRQGVGGWYYALARLSGKTPLVSAVFDRMGAALTFPVALCDSVAMTSSAGMSIGRMDVVQEILKEKTDYENLGGAAMHAKISGSADWVETEESRVLARIKAYLSYFPDQSGAALPQKAFAYSSNVLDTQSFIPDHPLKILDMDGLIATVSDDSSVLELKERYAREMITAFASFDGHVAGIVANRSKEKGGLLFPQSCRKAARFISLCDAFGIPLVFLSDSPGFMVGSEVEQQGSIRHGAHLFQTISNANTAILSVVVRRSYTAGVYAMAGGGMRPDRFVALPSAIISIYGEAVARQLMTDSQDSEKLQADQMLQAAHDPEHFLNMGMLDAVIPFDTLRQEIIHFIRVHQDGGRASKKPVPAI